MQTIWILEDDPRLSDLLKVVLEQEGHRLDVFTDPGSLRDALRAYSPDLLLVDIDHDQLDATALFRGLRDDPRTGDLPILVLSQEEGVALRCRTLSAGADEVVAKPFDSLELVLRTRARLRRSKRQGLAAPIPRRAGDFVLDYGTHMATIEGREVPLTQGEFAILDYLLSRPGRAVGASILLVEALGYPPRVGKSEIVRSHVHNLRLKIEPDPAHPTRLVNIPRVGYMVRFEREHIAA